MGTTVKPQFTVTDDDEDQKPNPPAPGGLTVGDDDDDATATPPSDQDLSNFTPQMREKVKSGVVKMQPPTKFEQGKDIKENYGFTPGNILSNAYEGAKGTLGAVAGAGYDALLGEGTDAQGEEHHGLGGLVGLDSEGHFNPMARASMLAHKYVIDPASSELGKAKEEAAQGHILGAVGHAGAAALPVLGPVAAGLGEQAGTGDIGGAAGQVAGGVAAGEALPHVGKLADVADKAVRGTPLTDEGKLEAAKQQAMVVKKPSMNETEYSDKVTAALPDLQKAAQDNIGKVKTPRDAVAAINGRISQIEAPISDHIAQLGDVPENQVPTDAVNHAVMNAVDAELAKRPGMFTPEEIVKAKATVQKFLGDQPTKSLTELENNRKRFNQESQDYYSSKPADKRAMDVSEATAVAQRAAGDEIRNLNYGPDDGSSPGFLEKAGVTAQDAQGNAVPIRAVRKQVGNLIDVRNHFEDAITRAEAAGDHSIFKSMRSGPSLAAGGLGAAAGLVAGGPIGALFGTMAGEGAKAWGDYLKSKNPNLNVEKMFRNLGKVEAEPNVSNVRTANPVHQYPQPIGPQNVQFATAQGPQLPPEPFTMNATTKPNASQMWQPQVGELPNVGFPERPFRAGGEHGFSSESPLPATIAPPAVPSKFRRESVGQPGAELHPIGATDANRLGAEGLGGVRVPPGSRMLPAPQEAPLGTINGTQGELNLPPENAPLFNIPVGGKRAEAAGLGNVEKVKPEPRGVLRRIGEDEEPKAAPSRQAEKLREASADITDYRENASEPTFVPGKTAKVVANVPEAVKRAIGDTGLEYVGTDKLGINHLHDPESGNTLAVLDKDLDPVKVKARLEDKRAQVEAAKETQKKNESDTTEAAVKSPEDYPVVKAGDTLKSGLEVGDKIKNQDSIGASLDDYKIHKGIRDIPMQGWSADLKDLFYDAKDKQRARDLAEQIKHSGRIDPLIVAFDKEGPYILEGAHRLGALKLLGVDSFPAMVVEDLSEEPESVKTEEPKAEAAAPPMQQAAKSLADKIGASVVGSAAKDDGTPRDIDLRIDGKYDTEGTAAKLKAEGYEPSGSSVLTPKEVEEWGKPSGTGGWKRIEHFENKEGRKLDVWHDADEEPSAPSNEEAKQEEPETYYHGNNSATLEPRNGPMYVSKSKTFAKAYGEARQIGGTPTAHEVAVDLKNPASEAQVEAAVKQAGLDPVEEGASLAELASRPAVMKILKDKGFDGIKDVTDFGFEHDFQEEPVSMVFDAKSQITPKETPAEPSEELKFPNLGGKIPDAPRVPSEGIFPAIRTTDGQIFHDPNPYGNTHVNFMKQKGIPPDKVKDGGWVTNGDYEPSERSDTSRYAEQARAALKVQESREARTAKSEEPATVEANEKKIVPAEAPTSAKFKNWFGDSKIVDEKGNPQVVYHGTGEQFKKFDLRKSAQGILWFTSDKAGIEGGTVGASGKGHIMELYAKLKNPAGWDEYGQKSLGELRRDGYDGAILKNKDGSFDGFAFDPKQLKLTEEFAKKSKKPKS